jgi:hypothetical protein
MNTSPVLWIVTVLMAVAALWFILLPMSKGKIPVTKTVLAAAFAAIALAVGLYAALGRPAATGGSLPHSADTERKAGGEQPSSGNLGSVDSLLAGLEEKLAANPDDAKGWLLLAKSYSHLGRTEDARVAYARATALGLQDADVEASLNGANSVATVSPTILGRLTITDTARRRVDPQDSIFIFAKSTDGSPMPVAVLRKVAADLPFDFELSDKQAMSPTARLSATPVVTITARVSKSGNAMQAEPGLEVVSPPIQVGKDILVELQLGSSESSE